MTGNQLRKQVHQQIDVLPEDVLREVADFLAFVLARRQKENLSEWDDDTWQQMALEQFFRDNDEVDYTVDDAIEVYKE
jgi:hypothetical protein